MPVEAVHSRLRSGLARLRTLLDDWLAERRTARGALLALAGWKPASWIVVPGLGPIAVKKLLLAVLALAFGLLTCRALLPEPGDRTPRPTGTPPAELASEGAPAPGLANARPLPIETTTPPGWGPDVDLATVDRELDLHGVVVREDGSPIAGAAVRTLAYPGRRTFTLDFDAYVRAVDGPATRTSRDGAFLLRLRRAERLDLVVSASGFATQQWPDCLAGGRVRVVLRPAARLHVIVRDGRGQGVQGTELRLSSQAGALEAAFDRRMRTDAEGRAVFDDLQGPAIARLEATPETLGTPHEKQVTVPSNGETSVTIDLPPGRTLTGCVTDGSTGAPIVGARVGMGWVLARSVTTDPDGVYILQGWTGKGEALIHVLADCFGRAARRVDSADVLDFALEKGDTVVGRLVRADGSPVAKAHLSAVAYSIAGNEEALCVRAGESGDDGSFRLGGLRHDLPHTLIVLAEGQARTLLDFAPPAAVGGTVSVGDVVLAASRRMEGRVIDEEGRPKPRVTVKLAGSNGDRARLRAGAPTLDFPYGNREACLTDDLGRFRFLDLAPGPYHLTAVPTGEVEIDRDVELGAEDLLGVELRAASGRTLRVRVVDSAGVGVAGVGVELADALTGAKRGQARSDPDGLASFVVPRSEDVQAVFTLPPPIGGKTFLHPEALAIERMAAEVRLVLRDAVLVSGKVVDADDQPLEGVQVIARLGRRTLATDFCDSEGRFELVVDATLPFDLDLGTFIFLHDLLPSPYVGSLRGLLGDRSDLIVRAATVARDRRLRVLVLDPEGRPAEGVTLTPASEWRGQWAIGTTTDASGFVEWAGLESRAASFAVWLGPKSAGAGRWLGQVVGPIEPDGQTLTVRLREGVRVTGTVIRPDGTPSPRAQVLARKGDVLVGGSVAAEDGAFTLLLDPEQFPLSIHASDKSDAQLRAMLEDLRAPETVITLHLVRKD